MIRAFIAAELPQVLRDDVATLQADLASSNADVKWVDPKNLHLTLKFLGDIEESRIPSLEEALIPSVSGFPSFTFSLEGIGAFPRTTDPRVVWVGVSEGKEKLTGLAAAMEKACEGLGFPREERPFSAHLTIGRVRSRDRLASLIKRLQGAEFRGGAPAPVEKLTLFQSALSPHGPTYTPLAAIPLG